MQNILEEDVSINKAFELRQYTRAVNRQKWPILVLMLVAITTTFLISKRQAAVYQTAITIALHGSVAETFELPTTLNQIIGSDALLTDIIADTDLDDTVVGLRSRLHAEILNDTGIVVITVKDSQRNRTKLIADAAANRFMAAARKLDSGQAIRDKKRKQVRAELAEVEREIETMKAELVRAQKSDISDELAKASAVNGLRGSLSSLKSRRYSLVKEVPEDPPVSQIIAEPIKPDAPLPTNLARNLMLSAVSALLFGISVSIVLQPRLVEDTPPLV